MSVFQKIRQGTEDYLRVRKETARLKETASRLPRGLECVFYAETKNDWIYFEGLILELIERRDQSVVYLTSSPDDSAFDFAHKNFSAFYVGEGVARTVLFKSIECKVMIMTLTDLDQLFLKRSVHDVHYVYLFHAIVSAHMVYRERSFNGYDAFLTVGPHHDREIEALHAFYGIEPKKTVPFGYYRLEKLIRENTDRLEASTDPESESRSPEILIAPSWGDHSITRTVLLPLIDELLAGDYRVTFRPHPMSFRRDAEILDAAKDRFGNNAKVQFDFDIRSSDSLGRADLMISDWSGSALEFAFGFERPVLFVDTKPKMNNADFEAFNQFQTEKHGGPIECIEKSLRTVLGDTLDPNQLAFAREKINRLLEDRERTREAILRCRQESIAHLGNSSAIGADYVVDFLAHN